MPKLGSPIAHWDVLCLGEIVIFMISTMKNDRNLGQDRSTGMSFLLEPHCHFGHEHWAMSIYTDDLDLGRYDWDCASARRDLWVYDMALTLRRVGEHLSVHILLIYFEPKIWRKPPQRCPRRISALPWLLCHWTWTRKPPRGAGEVKMTLIFAQKTFFNYFRSSLMHKHAALPPKLPLRQTCSFKSFF